MFNSLVVEVLVFYLIELMMLLIIIFDIVFEFLCMYCDCRSELFLDLYLYFVEGMFEYFLVYLFLEE